MNNVHIVSRYDFAASCMFCRQSTVNVHHSLRLQPYQSRPSSLRVVLARHKRLFDSDDHSVDDSDAHVVGDLHGEPVADLFRKEFGRIINSRKDRIKVSPCGTRGVDARGNMIYFFTPVRSGSETHDALPSGRSSSRRMPEAKAKQSKRGISAAATTAAKVYSSDDALIWADARTSKHQPEQVAHPEEAAERATRKAEKLAWKLARQQAWDSMGAAEKAHRQASDKSRAALTPEQVLALINSINGSSPTLKLGRRGVSPQVGQALQEMWRGREVVRVRVGDDRTASNRNMVDMGKTIAELEEATGGYVLHQSGRSMILYREQDWVKPQAAAAAPAAGAQAAQLPDGQHCEELGHEEQQAPDQEVAETGAVVPDTGIM